MLRSRYFWKLSGIYGALIVSATVLSAGLGQRGGTVSWTAVPAVAAGAVAAGSILAWSIAASLRKIVDSAEAISRGAFERRVPVPSRDEVGDLARIFNTMSEELRRSMAMTSAEGNKLNAILSSMAEGVVAVDRDERIVHMNQVAGRIFGAVPDEVFSRPIWEVTRIREVTESITQTLRSEAVGHRVALLPGATDRYLDLHTSPLRAGGDGPALSPLDPPQGTVGAVLVIHDLTELRRLETVRRDFIGNVSHELKTPVTAIRGIVETLLDDPEIDDALRHRFLEKISRQAERMSNIVADLLSLSRLESSDSPLEVSPLDVRDVLAESIRALQPAAEARHISILSDWPDRPLAVDGEEEALLQAVGNLLSNAVKYSPSGGEVAVRARQDSGWVVIEVRDQGPGIEPRHHARLFERFYRVDEARSRELGGTGLGLAIVKHTALALGGDVSVESVPGEGSTFLVRLPFSRDHETWDDLRTQDVRDLVASDQRH